MPSQLWSRGETAAMLLLCALCLGGVAACWHAIADKTWWRDQLGGMSLGALFAGLFVLVVVAWIVAGMRRLRAGIRELAGRRRESFSLESPARDLSVSDILELSSDLVSAESMTRRHRPSCMLMRGKRAETIPADRADAYGSCGVCKS